MGARKVQERLGCLLVMVVGNDGERGCVVVCVRQPAPRCYVKMFEEWPHLQAKTAGQDTVCFCCFRRHGHRGGFLAVTELADSVAAILSTFQGQLSAVSSSVQKFVTFV